MREPSPIDIVEKIDDSLFRTFISHGIVFRSLFSDSIQTTLRIMMSGGLLQPDFSSSLHFAFKKSEPFAAQFNVQVKKIKKNMNIVPMESTFSKRHSKNSVKLLFRLKLEDGNVLITTISGASLGLKKWENFAIILGTFYNLGFIKFEHQQVQRIIRRADRILKERSECPKISTRELSISQYVETVFDAIKGNPTIIA